MFGLTGQQWSYDDLESSTVAPDLSCVCTYDTDTDTDTDRGVPKVPHEPRKFQNLLTFSVNLWRIEQQGRDSKKRKGKFGLYRKVSTNSVHL